MTHLRKIMLEELQARKSPSSCWTYQGFDSVVGHVFQVMKLKPGFVKVRSRGLKKNAHRLFLTCALINLLVSCRKLLAVA